jgi:hypothetical protein
LGTSTFAGACCTTNDTIIGGDAQRFYRVKKISPAICQCPSGP